MSKVYLVFPKVEAPNFNASAGAYISGVPQPTAICGLTHAFCLVWNRVRPGELASTFSPVVYAISNYSGLQGQSRNPKSQFAQKTDAAKSPSAAMTDRPRASMIFSLIMEIDLKKEDAFSDAGVISFIESTFESLRLSGASLWLLAPPVLKDTKLKALKAIPSDSFVLSDESSLMKSWLDASPKMPVSSAIAHMCARPKDRETYKPRYVPIISGVHRLTDLAKFPGSKNDWLHAYAEPVIGLARFRSLASVCRAHRDATNTEYQESVDVVCPDGAVVSTQSMPSIFWSYANFPHGSDFNLTCGYN